MRSFKRFLSYVVLGCVFVAMVAFHKPLAASITQLAYNLIQDEGVPLAKRGTINCTGTGITCSDSGGVTVLNVGGGAGGTAGSPLFVQTASVTVTGNSEVTLIGSGVGSLTIPANWFTAAGSVMDVCHSGILTTNAVPGTIRLRLKFGATVIADTGAVTPVVSLTTSAYENCLRLTARTVGAMGTIMVSNIFPTAGTTPGAISFTNPTPGTAVTVDTTATQVVDLTVLFSLAATNSITSTNFYMVGPGSAVSSVYGLTGAVVPKVDQQDAVVFCSDAGASDTYACNLTPAISAYVTGTHYRFKANTANTGAASINFNSLGPTTIVKVAGGITTTLANNDILAGQWVDLVYDGANMQMQSLLGNAPSGGGGFVLVEQHTAAASASLDFTTCISSTYDEYEVDLVNLQPVTDNVNILIRMSTDGGMTYDSGANYSVERHGFLIASDTSSGGTGQTSIQINNSGVSNSANWSQNGHFRLYNPGGSIFKQIVGDWGGLITSTSQRTFFMYHGTYESTTAVNAFQVLYSSGNIAIGTVRCYGLAK